MLMGGLTYLCAPWSIATLLATARIRTWRRICASAVALLVAWMVVDGIYVLYHGYMGNQMFRLENFYASSALYFLAGSIWLYRGSLREFVLNVRSVFEDVPSDRVAEGDPRQEQPRAPRDER